MIDTPAMWVEPSTSLKSTSNQNLFYDKKPSSNWRFVTLDVYLELLQFSYLNPIVAALLTSVRNYKFVIFSLLSNGRLASTKMNNKKISTFHLSPDRVL